MSDKDKTILDDNNTFPQITDIQTYIAETETRILEAFEKILRNFMELNIEPIIEMLSEAKDKETKKRLQKLLSEYKKTSLLSKFFLGLIRAKKTLSLEQLKKVLGEGELIALQRKISKKMPTIR